MCMGIPPYTFSHFYKGRQLDNSKWNGLSFVLAGFSLRAFKGSQGLPMWSKGVLDYDSGVCPFKEVKTTAKILIILAF